MNSKYLVTLQFNNRVSHTFSHTIHSDMVSSTSYNNPSSFGGFKYGNVYLVELPTSVELTGHRLIAPGYIPAYTTGGTFASVDMGITTYAIYTWLIRCSEDTFMMQHYTDDEEIFIGDMYRYFNPI